MIILGNGHLRTDTYTNEMQHTKKSWFPTYTRQSIKNEKHFFTHTDIVLMLLDYLEKSGMFGFSLLDRWCKTFSGAYYYTILQYHRDRDRRWKQVDKYICILSANSNSTNYVNIFGDEIE